MKAGIVLCGLLCLASIVWGADSLLDQADAAFKQGRYDEAIALYSAVIRAEPRMSEPTSKRGALIRQKDGMMKQSQPTIQAPAETCRSSETCHIPRTRGSLWKQGRYDEAVTVLGKRRSSRRTMFISSICWEQCTSKRVSNAKRVRPLKRRCDLPKRALEARTRSSRRGMLRDIRLRLLPHQRPCCQRSSN